MVGHLSQGFSRLEVKSTTESLVDAFALARDGSAYVPPNIDEDPYYLLY